MSTSENGHIELIHDPGAMRAWSETESRRDHRVGLVPTMGALHDGHLELVDRAGRESDRVIVSIFVNPTQFGPGEDYEAYPRSLETDMERLRRQGIASAVFAPSADAMYPHGEPLTWVTVSKMGEHLCGASRPGHFRGVTTVVTKLFTICRPDIAVFGLKDAQQFFILRRMTEELHLPVRLVGVPTVREPDGLALSSRNKYLTQAQRYDARVMSRAVKKARSLVEQGESDPQVVEAAIRSEIESVDSSRLDYARVVETATLQPVAELQPGMTVLAAAAAWFGQARLIDNAIVDVP